MLSRPQQILLKRAQRQAALPDDEYRDALELTTNCRSRKDPALTDRHLDLLLAYFEAIYFRKVDTGELQPVGNASAVFRQRGFWAAKNTKLETSRDRFRDFNLNWSITKLENKLGELGFGKNYLAAIRSKVLPDRADDHGLYLYRAALTRTLKAKKRKALSTQL